MSGNNHKTVINFRLSSAERKTIELIQVREGYATLSEAARAVLREGFEKYGETGIGIREILSATRLESSGAAGR